MKGRKGEREEGKKKKRKFMTKCKWHPNYTTGKICPDTWDKCPNGTPKDLLDLKGEKNVLTAEQCERIK